MRGSGQCRPSQRCLPSPLKEEGVRRLPTAYGSPGTPAQKGLAQSCRPSLPHSRPISYSGQNQHLVCPLTDCSSVWKLLFYLKSRTVPSSRLVMRKHSVEFGILDF